MQCSRPARSSTGPSAPRPGASFVGPLAAAAGPIAHRVQSLSAPRVPAGTWAEPFRLMGCTAGSAECVIQIGRLLPRSPIVRRLLAPAKTTLPPAHPPMAPLIRRYRAPPQCFLDPELRLEPVRI